MPIEVKLVVDKEKQKVVFAECGSDFADVLCNFLTLPLGIIVKLLNKQSELGCMDNLYRSVEDLDADKYLQTASCKTMLLQPRSIAARKCEGLAVNICDDLNLKPRRIFLCSNWECAYKKFPFYSSVSGVKYSCGKVMDNCWERNKIVSTDGVFLKKSVVQFLVSDDLHICFASSASVGFSFLVNHGANDLAAYEERKIMVDKTQILALLKSSLLSTTPLTNVFLGKPVNNSTAKIPTTPSSRIKIERDDDYEPVGITVKILESNNVKLVEAGSDFVDQLFSFLTLPLAQVLSLLGAGCLTPGCIHNLYTSIDNMRIDNNEEILSDENKEMLLHTKLPPYFGCSSQVLKIDEIEPQTCTLRECKSCFETNPNSCSHTVDRVRQTDLNPKLVKAAAENGGGFAVTNVRFIIDSDLTVKPFSITSTMQTLKDLGVLIGSVQQRSVIVNETKALRFLEACLTSSIGIINSLLN